ncbi:MAG: NUDIX hydrolase, partial [Moorea sp. SIO3I7]|nr:NUDIX hydrolase [Moorena sp. SIO3I7]
MISIQPWKTMKSKLVFDNKWCRVRQDEVELPSGEIVDDYFINVRPDIVLILAITCDRNVVFVRQYRHGVGEILLE